jgi:hypothetical protein
MAALASDPVSSPSWPAAWIPYPHQYPGSKGGVASSSAVTPPAPPVTTYDHLGNRAVIGGSAGSTA